MLTVSIALICLILLDLLALRFGRQEWDTRSPRTWW